MEEHTQNQPKKETPLFEALGPKRSFIFGLIMTVLTIGTIGFIYQLAFGANGLGSLAKSDDNKEFVTTNTSTTNTAGTTAVTISPITSDDHVRGDLETADLVIVEYSDLECPFCKDYHPNVSQVYNDYGGKVAWVYRHFPLDSLHAQAREEAEASECVAELGGDEAFWSFIDNIYEVTPSNDGLDLAKLPEYAAAAGVDAGEFQTCLDSGRSAEKVQADYDDATQNAGGQGTPHTVFVSRDGQTQTASGRISVSQIKAIIDPMIQ